MDFKVRTAEEDDCSEITRLSNELGYPSSFKKVCEILDMVLTHDDHQLFVVAGDQKLFGYIHLVHSLRLSSEPFIEIAAIVVNETSRNMGIGNALITEAEIWTKHKGFDFIRIRSNIIREDAHQFFYHKGFKKLKSQDVFFKEMINP